MPKHWLTRLPLWQSTFFLECISVIIYESVSMFECIWSYDAKKDVKTMIIYISRWFNVLVLLHWINLLSAISHFVIPRSMPNADQNHGIDPKCLSMPINSSQCREESIGIDHYWSKSIDIGINARILIGIDQNWSLIKGVLWLSMDLVARQTDTHAW